MFLSTALFAGNDGAQKLYQCENKKQNYKVTYSESSFAGIPQLGIVQGKKTTLYQGDEVHIKLSKKDKTLEISNTKKTHFLYLPSPLEKEKKLFNAQLKNSKTGRLTSLKCSVQEVVF